MILVDNQNRMILHEAPKRKPPKPKPEPNRIKRFDYHRRRALRNFNRVLYKLTGADEHKAMYSKYLSDTLRSRIGMLTGNNDEQLFNNREELQLVKAAALDVVQMYDMILQITQQQVDRLEELDCGEEDKLKRIQGILTTRVSAGQMMHDVLADVVEMSAKVQEVEEIRVRKLPYAGPRGTDLLPDEDVIAMDQTIPKIA
jgi:hypothetical protein